MKQTEIIVFRVDLETKRELEEMAKYFRVNLSSLMRTMILFYADRFNKGQDDEVEWTRKGYNRTKI